MACTIDYIDGFWHGKDTTRTIYTSFIDTYFPADDYDAEGIYNSLRNGLVHMFTIKDSMYTLIHNRPEYHLNVQNNRILLNAGDFRDDLKSATGKFFDDVETTPNY
jgi:hypothetical protein